jgi:hypothetical protein
MRVDLKELCDKLGVGYVLSPYETCPWSAYDSTTGITASGEVRMNNEGDEIEAELQFMFDDPEEGKPPVEQICYIFCKPVTQGKWSPTTLKVRGNDEEGALYEWETKGCNFFAACAQEIKMGNIPDIDAIYDKEMDGKERFRDGRQGNASKAPKIKPQALLGMKGGRGF